MLEDRIYASSYTNIIETLVYSNLIILSVISSAMGPGAKSQLAKALVYSLVGMVIVIMMGIIMYHFFTAHLLRLRIQAKISKVFRHTKNIKERG